MEYKKIDSSFFVQCAEQHESFHEVYRLQNKTNSVVTISERFQKKGYHECTVEVFRYFSQVGF